MKHIERFHEFLYCATLGGMVGSAFYLVTGILPGMIAVMIWGWCSSHIVASFTEKRRIAEVRELKEIYTRPASDGK